MIDFVTEDTDSRRVRFFKGSAKEQAYRVGRQIIGVAFVVIVCMWSLIGWSLSSEHRAAFATARTQESNVLAAFVGDLTRSFDAAERDLGVVGAAVAGLRPLAPAGEIQNRIGQIRGWLIDPAAEIRVLWADGSVAYPPDGAVSARAQADFKRLRDDPKAGVLVEAGGGQSGGGQRGDGARGDGATVVVSRRLIGGDGGFAGVASVRIKAASLSTLGVGIDLGRHGIVAVFGADGRPLAGFDRGHPDGSAAVGADLGALVSAADRLADGAPGIIRRGRGDEVERLFAARRLARVPVTVLAGLGMTDVVGVMHGHIWSMTAAGVVTTCLIVMLTLLLLREVWRRTNRDIELAADRERLQVAHQQIDVERARLAETNRALVESKEKAEVANRTKSQFLAHMSHELRTPLHAIIGFTELIRDQAPVRPGSPPIAGYAADILSSGRHLLELINTILDIAKIESGTTTLTESLFPVADLAQNALVLVRAQAQARGVTLELVLPESPLRLFADRTRLLQVLINLLSNAVKFSPDDGRIVLSAAVNPAGDAVLSVIDSGIGMTEEEIAVAFEPFGQVDNARSRNFEGTGLGLPLAARLAELHGGSLELTSIKGRGTAARMIMPEWRVGRRGRAPG